MTNGAITLPSTLESKVAPRTPFKLATFAKPGGSPFAAIVLGDDAIDLSTAHAAYRASGHGGTVSATASISCLLENWDANFPALQEIVAFLEKEGLHPGAATLGSLRALPPILRPGKMFYAAQNFQEHVDEMIRAGMTPTASTQPCGFSMTGRYARSRRCSNPVALAVAAEAATEATKQEDDKYSISPIEMIYLPLQHQIVLNASVVEIISDGMRAAGGEALA